MIQRTTKLMAVLLALGVGLVACEDMTTTGPENQPETPGVPDGPATLKVLLTDAAADYVGAAWVDIGEVQLLPADESLPPVTLTEDGTDGPIDLLQLQDGATAQLADTAIDAGMYKQLRLIVESASVKLMDGYTFRDGTDSMSLKVPSGAQTGIKLNLWPADGMEEGAMMDEDDDGHGVQIVPGETVLVLDFDVNQSFRIQGNPETPAGIKSMLFTPTIRAIVRDVAGSISGTVTGAADSIDVENLTVTADPTGPGTVPGYQTMTATALTADDGTYTIHFLVPGEYEVSVAVPEGYYSDPMITTVTVGEAEDVMGVDFLIDEAGSLAGTVSATDDSINVDGLTVNAEGPGGSLTATTAEDGTYLFDGVVPGDWAVTVDVPEGFFTTPDTANVTVGPGEDVTGVDFVVDDAAGSIAGTVSPAADSIDVEDLTVTAADTAAAIEYTATTDSEGVYSMDYVVPGEYLVTVAVPEGFATTPDTATVTVGVNEDVADVDFDVDEAAEEGGS